MQIMIRDAVIMMILLPSEIAFCAIFSSLSCNWVAAYQFSGTL